MASADFVFRALRQFRGFVVQILHSHVDFDAHPALLPTLSRYQKPRRVGRGVVSPMEWLNAQCRHPGRQLRQGRGDQPVRPSVWPAGGDQRDQLLLAARLQGCHPTPVLGLLPPGMSASLFSVRVNENTLPLGQARFPHG
jgi:hypothetical protein